MARTRVTVNPDRQEACIGPIRVPLTARELDLLQFLMKVPGTICSRTRILEEVWKYHFDPRTNIVEVYIRRLRSKLAEAGAPEHIETVRGVGYRIRPETRDKP